MNLSNAVKKFQNRCLAMNLSTKTMTTYYYNIKSFVSFLNTQTSIREIEDVKTEDVLLYLSHLRKENYSPETIKDRYVTLNTLFNFLHDEQYISNNPMVKVKKPKIPKIHARTFTVEEINKILSCFQLDSFVGYRNYTIMNILFGTGIRKSELLNLSLLDVNIEEHSLSVIGKGNKQRVIPLTKTLRKILVKYLKLREEQIKKSKNNSVALIITNSGNRLTYGGLREVFKYVGNETNLSQIRLSPHTWRHTFAKMFLLNGGNLFALQKILGHEDISTTKMYVDYTNLEIETQMQQSSPVENRRWSWYGN